MKRLGIIGGGQLARMMGEEIQSKKLPVELIVLDPTINCPASPFIAEQIVGNYDDPEKILELASRDIEVITFEIERTHPVLNSISERGIQVNPSPRTLEIIKDKYVQYEFLRKHHLPLPDSEPVSTISDLERISKTFGFPFMLKSRLGSYDGRGNFLLESSSDFVTALSYFGNNSIMAQKFVMFEQEISVIAARDTKGNIKTYKVGKNYHSSNILSRTIVGNNILPRSTEKNAREIAYETLKIFQGAGVFGIEMFQTNGEVLINEIAPRVHNSGHWTLGGSCKTSQFEQHIRAVFGMPLGDTDMLYDNAVMINLIGNSNFSGPYIIDGCQNITDFKNYKADLRLYGKQEVRPGRKIGHFTIYGNENIEKVVEYAQMIKDSLTFFPKELN